MIADTIAILAHAERDLDIWRTAAHSLASQRVDDFVRLLAAMDALRKSQAHSRTQREQIEALQEQNELLRAELRERMGVMAVC